MCVKFEATSYSRNRNIFPPRPFATLIMQTFEILMCFIRDFWTVLPCIFRGTK